VVQALREAGHRVRVLARGVTGEQDGDGLEHRAVDLGVGPLPEDLLDGCDAVVNLVGIKAPRGDNDFARAHVAVVDNLRAAMTAAGIERLVHVSVAQAEDTTGPYAQTKREGERRVQQGGLAVTVLRPGLVYGPGDDALRNLVRMVRLAPLCPVPGGAKGPLPAIDVRDVAAAVVATLERPQTAGRCIDLVGPEVLDLRALVRRVSQALRLPTLTPTLPGVLARAGAAVMERLLPDPLLSRSQLSMLTRGLPGDPKQAEEQLGIRPRPLEEERIREIAADVPDLLPSARLVTSRDHRRWLTQQASLVPGWPLVLALATAVMLVLPVVLPGVWVRMAVINTAMALVLLGLGRRAWAPLLRPSGSRLALGLVAALVLYGAADLFMAGLRLGLPDLAAQVQAVYAWSDTAPLGLRLALLVPIVFGEDLLWRGAITLPLAARFGALTGCLLGGTVFALAHLTSGPPLLVLAAMAMGSIWSALAIRTRSLVPVVVCHLAWDVLVMFVRPL
jgi:NADH dehydrogenase